MPSIDETAKFLKKIGKGAVLSNPITAGAAATMLLGPEKVAKYAKLPQQSFEASEASRAGYGYDPSPALEAAWLLAGGRAPTIKPGEAGIFGGMLAKNANPKMRIRAAEMEDKIFRNQIAKAQSPEEIYRTVVAGYNRDSGLGARDIFTDTGMFRGQDFKWRHYIDDSQSRISSSGYGSAAAGHPVILSHVLEHPALFEAYPQLKSMRVHGDIPENSAGAFFPHNNTIGLGIGPSGREYTNAQKQDILLHEIQHAVQKMENFAPGSNPAFLSEIYKKRHNAEPANLKQASLQAYKDHAGEAESRLVEFQNDLNERAMLGENLVNGNDYLKQLLSGPAGALRQMNPRPIFDSNWLNTQPPFLSRTLRDVMRSDTQSLELMGAAKKNMTDRMRKDITPKPPGWGDTGQ